MSQDTQELSAPALADAAPEERQLALQNNAGSDCLPTAQMLQTCTEDLYTQHAEAWDSLDLACMCLSVAKDNPAVSEFQQAFLGPHAAGLFQEVFQLERTVMLRGVDPVDLSRSTGITMH